MLWFILFFILKMMWELREEEVGRDDDDIQFSPKPRPSDGPLCGDGSH